MRTLSLILISAAVGFGQSHPSWWTFASPEATALVGIQGSYLRYSPAARFVQLKQMALGFPSLECLDAADQILISSPALLAMVSGGCQADALAQQAATKGWRSSSYRGVKIWVVPDQNALSIAQVQDQLLMLGKVPTLRAAIDRTMQEERRAYAKLLSRAARYAKEDLWVVSYRLPDPVASLFLPLEIKGSSFEGSVSFWEGLHLVAAIETASKPAAEALLDSLQSAIDERLGATGESDISLDGRTLLLRMNLTDARAAVVFPATNPPVQVAAAIPEAAKVDAPKVESPKPEPAKVVRIYGLDSGVKEIPLSSASK